MNHPAASRDRQTLQVVPIAPQLVMHLLLRTIPTTLLCLSLYIYLLGEFLLLAHSELASTCAGEVGMSVWCSDVEVVSQFT